MATYAYSDILASVRGRLHNQTGLLDATSSLVAINDGVRAAIAEIDFRSTKRRSSISPNLFNDVYQYACPTDLKGMKVISIQPQKLDRDRLTEYQLVTEESFDQLKQSRSNLLSFSDRDMVRKLLASIDTRDNLSITVSPLDSLTGSGSWAVFGDGTNISADTFDFIKGSGSIKYDISAAGGTTAGIEATNIPAFDLTNYKSAGSVFVWAYITSITNLTNFILKIGNSSTNNYQVTITTASDGTAFVNGWNLLRFDFSGKTTNGTVTDATANFARIYMTKTAGKISETDYRFDEIAIKRGQINSLTYYSKYIWQTSGGTWIENSTTSTDKLNLDTEEYPIVIEKCVAVAAQSIREFRNDFVIATREYERMKREYRSRYPSEALPIVSDYYFFDR